jgi:hypothetical protein
VKPEALSGEIVQGGVNETNQNYKTTLNLH